MTLAAGTKLGPYEVVGALGAGGMGEVYRARDQTLGREVALKILPETFAKDPERIARFEREAKTLASLNHPHIAGIYGLVDGPVDGHHVRALVMELVEGEDLAVRIARGAIPAPETLSIASQVADALEAAHERGIVHRDLKPANIKVRPDGVAKVLDFGLAKATDLTGSAPDLTHSPTITGGGTRDGVILGTAAYMSPEQARGHAMDARTDVWGFGCVLYEMLTGRRAFPGETVSDTIAAILAREPDWNALPPSAAPFANVLQRCLEKDTKRRLRNIGDVKLWLEDASTRTLTTGGTSGRRGPSLTVIAAAAVLGLVVGGAAIALLAPSRSRAPALAARFEVPSFQPNPFSADTFGTNVAISPDGSRIVYTAARGGVPELVLRRVDQIEATPIAGTEGGFNPFFSPDGQQLGFSTFSELKRVSLAGGSSVVICPVDAFFSGASWGPNNTIVFAQAALGLFRVSASGGTAEKLATPDAAKDEYGYAQPFVLPGGQGVLHTVVLRNSSTRVVFRGAGASDAATLVEGGFGARYLPSGYLVYGQNDRLMAVRFNVTAHQIAGSPAAVQDGVLNKVGDGMSNVASANDGTTVFVSGRNTSTSAQFVWFDRHGARVAPAIQQRLEYPRHAQLSPDGGRLALTVGPPGRGQIWIYDVSGAVQPVKLTFKDHNIFPTWSLDGKQISFFSRAGATGHVRTIPVDGSVVEPELLTGTAGAGLPLAWSPPDGAFLICEFPDHDKLWVMRTSDRKTSQWLQTPFAEYGATFAPNGHWLAYASNQTGASEIWVRPFPGPGVPVRVSSDGGRDPIWSHDGKEIFFSNGPKMMAARVGLLTQDFHAETPQVLFEGGFVHDETDPNWRVFDVGQDGRFLMLEALGVSEAPSIVVMQHWDEQLKRLLP